LFSEENVAFGNSNFSLPTPFYLPKKIPDETPGFASGVLRILFALLASCGKARTDGAHSRKKNGTRFQNFGDAWTIPGHGNYHKATRVPVLKRN
jgi:hypothetical protein